MIVEGIPGANVVPGEVTGDHFDVAGVFQQSVVDADLFQGAVSRSQGRGKIAGLQTAAAGERASSSHGVWVFKARSTTSARQVKMPEFQR